MGNENKTRREAPPLDDVVAALRAIRPERPGQREETPPVRKPRLREIKIPQARQAHLPDIAEIVKDGHPYEMIARGVAGYYGMDIALLYSHQRVQPAALVRQILMYLLERVLGLPLIEIGRALGLDHTTVMHGCKKIAALRVSDPRLHAQLTAFEEQFAPLQEKVAPFEGIANSTLAQAMHATVSEHRQRESWRYAQELGLPAFPAGLPLSHFDRYKAVLGALRDGRVARLKKKHAHAHRALTLRFGLDTLENPVYRTLGVVGKLMGGISRQRVLQLEEAALKFLGISEGSKGKPDALGR